MQGRKMPYRQGTMKGDWQLKKATGRDRAGELLRLDVGFAQLVFNGGFPETGVIYIHLIRLVTTMDSGSLRCVSRGVA